MTKMSLEFVELNIVDSSNTYTGGCSGGVSDCCTRVCTRVNNSSDDDLKSWEDYLEEVSGIIQY